MAIDWITDEAALATLYKPAMPTSILKVADHLTPEYRAWIAASRFCILSSVGPEGTDATPRGDDGPVVEISDDRTLLLPDWAGNNRIDSLRNIVRDPRCSLMFLIPGNMNVVRVNGTGRITADDGLRARFDKDGKRPRTVLEVRLGEVYFQCAKALMRARLWRGEASPDVPTAGDFLKAMTKGAEGGAAYDAAYEARAKAQFWER
jgi:PPOX class probable FMN-dependent enzyme